MPSLLLATTQPPPFSQPPPPGPLVSQTTVTASSHKPTMQPFKVCLPAANRRSSKPCAARSFLGREIRQELEYQIALAWEYQNKTNRKTCYMLLFLFVGCFSPRHTLKKGHMIWARDYRDCCTGSNMKTRRPRKTVFVHCTIIQFWIRKVHLSKSRTKDPTQKYSSRSSRKCFLAFPQWLFWVGGRRRRRKW